MKELNWQQFDQAVTLMSEESFAEDDWPLDGPRSCMWWMRATYKLGMTPIARH